jgi:transposase-like protein
MKKQIEFYLVKEKAYTIDELVSLLGISKSTIERWRRDAQSQRFGSTGLGLTTAGSVLAKHSAIKSSLRNRGLAYLVLMMMMSQQFLFLNQIFI